MFHVRKRKGEKCYEEREREKTRMNGRKVLFMIFKCARVWCVCVLLSSLLKLDDSAESLQMCSSVVLVKDL